MFGGSSYTANDTLRKDNSAPTAFDGSYVSKVSTTSTGLTLAGLHGKLSVDEGRTNKLRAKNIEIYTAGDYGVLINLRGSKNEQY